MSRNRKAQITVFMIVGIILLFSSALLFYIRGQIIEGIPEEFVPTAEEVPLEAQPIKVFVEDCMQRVGKAAVKQIGLHGGYIDPSDREMTGMDFVVGIEPTESDGLKLFDSDNALLPYWWYLDADNDCSGDCVVGSNRPALRKAVGEPSLEGQMDRFIERNLAACIDDFTSFREQGFGITERGPFSSDVTVAEKEVIILLEYPITVAREGRTIDIDRFFTKLDVRLKDVFDFATELTELEIDSFFLELHAMNLISMYSWPSSMEKIPPTGDFTWGLGDYRIWTRSETQQKLESNILTVGIPMLQVLDTRNYFDKVIVRSTDEGYEIDPTGQGMMDMMRLDLNHSGRYSDFEVDFTYLDWWPIYLNINDKEVLAPDSVEGSGLLSWLGISNYRFWYDVSFPVMVTIRDPDAFAGEGFTFRFALEGNIRDNNHTSPAYVKLANDTGTTLACDMGQRNSGDINIEVKDAVTGEPVVARVSFVFGSEACFIGFSQVGEDGAARVDAPFPVGIGTLRVNNGNYLLHEELFVTRMDEGANHTVELMPYRYINASVFVRPLSYSDETGRYVLPAGAPASKLSPNYEDAMFIFKRMDNDTIGGFTTQLTASDSTNFSLLRIVPGTYEVKGFLFYEREDMPRRVPKEKLTFEVPFSDDVTVELNETVLNPYTEGGVRFDNETGYLEVGTDELFGSDRVVFYLLRFPPPMTHVGDIKNQPGLEQVAEIGKYSEIYRTELEPGWLD